MIHVTTTTHPANCYTAREYRGGQLVGVRLVVTEIHATRGDVWAVLARLTQPEPEEEGRSS